ncbi:hypothetical protein D9M70_602900 [compost metagenome]
MRQRTKRTHVVRVQQNGEQVLDGEVVGVVVRVGALQKAYVSQRHLRGQLRGAPILHSVAAGPQEVFHS